MTITLMNTTSAPNVLNKDVTTVEVITGTLHAPSSIINPIIRFNRSSPAGFNYLHIYEFDRYYYVKNVVSEYNDIIVVSAHVDVLMSHRAGIRASKGIAVRQEFNWNLFLDDGTYKCQQNPHIKVKKWPYEFNDFSYIFTIAGNGLASN